MMGGRRSIVSVVFAGHLLFGMLPGCAPSAPPAQAAVECNGAAVSNTLAGSVEFTAENGRCWPVGWNANYGGTAEAGAPCRYSTDCAPTCCSCGPLGGLSASTGLCNNGVCADVNTTCCAYAADNTFDPSCHPQPKTGANSD
jgi:hypothetical protein